MHATVNTARAGRNESRMSFHYGEALFRLASTYPTLLKVILEQIQNALDGEAKTIWLHINRKERVRQVIIRDDGSGVSKDNFEQALSRVCQSQKSADKLGRFGLGLISPVGQCQEFTFTSCPKPKTREYRTWTFNTAQIRSAAEPPSIPCIARTDLTLDHSHTAEMKIPWRTEVFIKKYNDDQVFGRLNMDELIDEMLTIYGRTMRLKKVKVHVKIVHPDGKEETRENIQARNFSGKKLAEEIFEEASVGKVIFRLYLSPMKERTKGRISVGEVGDEYRIPFGIFSRSTSDLIKDDTRAALLSGIFEGEIVGEKVQLLANRASFVRNDAFIGFCICIEDWFEKCGRLHLDQGQAERQQERYQNLGLRSLKMIEQLLRDPQNKCLLSVVQSFGQGTIGDGHAAVSKAKMGGKQDEAALSLDGNPGKHREPKTEADTPRTPPEREYPEHHPMSVLGPEGTRRTVVKRNSLGLQFSHDEMRGSNLLWSLDMKCGILSFNIRHPLWRACEKRDRDILRLQEFCCIQALTLHMLPNPELREAQRLALDEVTRSYVYLLLNSESMRGTSSFTRSKVNK